MTYVGTVTKQGTVKLPPDANLPEGTKVEVTPLPEGPIVTPWRNETDPFANAKPLDLSLLIGGYPDERDADEIIADLRAARKPRDWSK
jgi:hypothetical protein